MKNIITKIELGKRNKDRVNVFVDEEFSFSCSTELVFHHHLEKGKTINLDLLKDIIEEDNYIKCKSSALKFIEKSHKTEKEMTLKLLQKGYEEKTIARVMKFLKEYNFINDSKYAEVFIKDKSSSMGVNKIRYTLKGKGIEDNVIEKELHILESCEFEEENYRMLRSIAEKKYKQISSSEKDTIKASKKLCDFLARRGYTWGDIKKVIKEIDNNEYYI